MSQCGAVLLAEAQAHLLYIPEGVTWARSSNNRLAAAAPKLPSSLMWSAHNEVKKDRWISCSESHHPGGGGGVKDQWLGLKSFNYMYELNWKHR